MQYLDNFKYNVLEFTEKGLDMFYSLATYPETPNGRFGVGVLVMLFQCLGIVFSGSVVSLVENLCKYKRFLVYNYDCMLCGKTNTHVVLPNSTIGIISNSQGLEFLNSVVSSLDLSEEELSAKNKTQETQETQENDEIVVNEKTNEVIDWDDVISNVWTLIDIKCFKKDGKTTYKYIITNNGIDTESTSYSVSPSLCSF